SSHPLILQHAGILAEQWAGGRILEIGLDGHHALAAALVEYRIEQAEHFQIVGLSEAAAEHLQRFLEHDLRGAGRIGLQKAAQCSAANDHHLEWMDERGERTAREDETTEHTADYHENAENLDHRYRLEN